MEKKRGLSPVMATVLLVGMAVVLDVIIFFWARFFVGEAITKDGQAIELLCDQVDFKADAYGTPLTLYVENTGSVPLYGVEIREIGLFGDIIGVEAFQGSQVLAGETESVGIPSEAEVEDGDVLLVVPLLLGEVQDEPSRKKAHVCDVDYSKEIVVG